MVILCDVSFRMGIIWIILSEVIFETISLFELEMHSALTVPLKPHLEDILA